MICEGCGQRGAEGASFCGACGAALLVTCAGCDRQNPAANRFCQHCGAKLGVEEAPSPEPTGRGGERRHLTVMFVDLVGSTALAETIDVEDMRALLREFHGMCEAEIAVRDGVVANYVGDGLLAFFGYPMAHEDDAVQAVRTGLAIVQAMPELAARVGVSGLAARVGLHTGVTVVGETGTGAARIAADAVGETPNIAARLQALAGPNEVVISSVTQSLVEGFFHLESLGTPSLKGVSRPIGAATVQGETAVRTRLDAAAQRGFTPLVGRERELNALLEAWEQAKAGRGRVVLLGGEAGIGKSRLIHELRAGLDPDAVVIDFQCTPRHTHSGLHPLIEHLRRAIRADVARGDDDLLDRIEELVRLSDGDPTVAVPVVAELLEVPFETRYERLEGSPELRKRRTLETVTGLLFGLAEGRPVLLVCEDVHWMDPTTFELIDDLVEQRPRPQLMTVITHRTDFAPPWPDYSHIERMTLSRLAAEDADRIIDLVAGEAGLPADLAAQVLARTDGVPLFLEELTQMLLEADAVTAPAAGAGELEHLVPSTLRDSIMARLDRLGPTLELAQFAAVAGREVSYAFLRAVWPGTTVDIDDGLRQLVESGLAYQRGSGARAVFAFKHALVQDVAYDSLLRSTRVEYHRLIAQSLLREFPDEVAAAPEVVAHHCALGGMAAEAVTYWRAAGERDLARYSPNESIVHLRRALDQLAALPPTPERIREELTLLTLIGPPLAATTGYGSVEVEDVYARAHSLCDQVDDPTLLFVALYGVFRTRLLRAEYDEAAAVAAQLQAQAANAAEPAFTIAAHRALGGVLVYRGERLSEALAVLDVGIDADVAGDPDPATCALLRDVADPGITSRAYAAWALWLLGRTEEALAVSEAAIDRATRLGHPFTLALARCFDLWLRQFEGDVDEVAARAEDAIRSTTEQGFAFWYGWAQVMRGWAAARQGDVERGVTDMEAGLVSWQATGSQLGRTYFLSLLADGLLLARRHGEAADLVAEAITLAEESGEEFWLADLYRLDGTVRRAIGDHAGAARAFELGLAAATRRGQVVLASRLSEAALDLERSRA